MKKAFSVLILLGFLVFLFLPLVVTAQESPPNECIIRGDTGIADCPKTGTTTYDEIHKGRVRGAVCCLFSTIYYVTNWIFTGLVAIVVILVLYGAFNILTAGGNVEKVTAGRNYVMYAAIGLFVALLAKAVPALVKLIGGVT